MVSKKLFHLHGGWHHMVLINVKCIKMVRIKGIEIFKVSGKKRITIDTNEMHTQNGINMNDVHNPLPAVADVHLHADVRARLIPDCRKPGDKCFDAAVLE
jgi:hypothetical protein